MNTTEFTINMQGQLNKFMPKSFSGANLPINYTHSEKLETPEFQANNDVNLDIAANLASERARDNGATEEEGRAAGTCKAWFEFRYIRLFAK